MEEVIDTVRRIEEILRDLNREAMNILRKTISANSEKV